MIHPVFPDSYDRIFIAVLLFFCVVCSCDTGSDGEGEADSGRDAAAEAGVDSGLDASMDSGMDATMDSGADADTGPDMDAAEQNDARRDTGMDSAGDDDDSGGCVTPPTEECGNSIVEEGEQCDDGNNGVPDDGCRDDCKFSCAKASRDCGDTEGNCLSYECVENDIGRVCEGATDEQDIPADGNPCTIDSCDGSTPVNENRTNGYPCDNQDGESDDYCKKGKCIDPVCGDEIRGPGEECDDGNEADSDGCSSECILEFCGDEILNNGEDCDDGNSDEEDGCTNLCHFSCSFPDLDCASDEPGDCLVPVCVANASGQVCGLDADSDDAPEDPDACSDGYCDGTTPSFRPMVDGWACDNQSDQPGDYCVGGECIDPVCGDRVLGPLEECDHDGTLNTITCSSECDIQCPADMVRIPADPAIKVNRAFCMDMYEASRSDATSDWMGSQTDIAVSQPGVIPWYVRPFDLNDLADFESACAAAGKRLCRKAEWYFGCTGPNRTKYVWGNTYDRNICNCVESCCDQYCIDHSIPPGDCYFANCGGISSSTVTRYQCMNRAPTGRFQGCESHFGAFDVNGNVWEVVPVNTVRGFEVRGGAFNCYSPDYRLKCTYNAGWDDLYAGFRCCASVE
jgi:cysteine-rich repeat protein